eukprot:TRINITY_DN11720_c0_g1_i1.p1 TRINITY_DN11720_c0_g1~~TRINITY_DN11720_c0_g1_i1.p1  ORF type:complete len:100 (+),score=5.31 TRINITY_DN11720_c0_g1_i1:144-443(+)
MIRQATIRLLLNKSLFNIAIDFLNYMLLNSLPSQLIKINEFTIPPFMYCDDTIVCVKDPQAILTVLNIFKSFADFSGLKINTSKSSIIDWDSSSTRMDL